MILDARNGHTGWRCYDCEAMRPVRYAILVDDQTAMWAEYRFKLVDGVRITVLVNDETELIWHQEKTIKIIPDLKMVLFNEIADPESVEVQQAEAVEA